jgi:hypothetical protein
VSSPLAIAAVTAVFKDLLNDGLIDNDVLPTAIGAFKVTALPPDRVSLNGAGAVSQLNIFLYQVMPNPGWRNIGYPSRDSAGNVISNPLLALDLYYLLTAYGTDDLHAEILLGFAMQLLHETPVLTRAAIRQALDPAVATAGSSVKDIITRSGAANLADQVEQIKISPLSLNTEEQSHLWTAFQTNYRPSVAYQVSVVLIESKKPVKPAMPVTRRNIYTVPLRHPNITEVEQEPPNKKIMRSQPPSVEWATAIPMTVRGNNLLAPDVSVVFESGEESPDPNIIPTPRTATIDAANSTQEQLQITLPTQLRAGLRSLQVVHPLAMGAPTLHKGFESNRTAFLLRPKIRPAGTGYDIVLSDKTGTGNAPRGATVTIKLDPAVGKKQDVVLMLNQTDALAGELPRAFSFARPPRVAADPETTNELVFPIAGVQRGKYLVRVQVDGAQSLLDTDGSGKYSAPVIDLT